MPLFHELARCIVCPLFVARRHTHTLSPPLLSVISLSQSRTHSLSLAVCSGGGPLPSWLTYSETASTLQGTPTGNVRGLYRLSAVVSLPQVLKQGVTPGNTNTIVFSLNVTNTAPVYSVRPLPPCARACVSCVRIVRFQHMLEACLCISVFPSAFGSILVVCACVHTCACCLYVCVCVSFVSL